jgi:hypothetical protein
MSPNAKHAFSNQDKGELMLRLTKKRAITGAVAISALVLAAGALAYFSSTGAGTASATVGSSTAVTLHGTVSGSLYPGASSTVTFTIDNTSSASERVGTITLTKVQPDGSHPTCSTTITGEKPDFTMAAVTVNKSYSPGSGQTVTPTGTLTMNETGANQDACQGATLTLTLASN